MKTRIATKEDFKVGAVLYCGADGFRFVLKNKCNHGANYGIWEARGEGGDKCVYESEAEGYVVELKNENN